MKTVKTIAIALFLVTSNNLVAQTKSLVQVKKEGVLEVTVPKEEKAFLVKLLDANQVELFSERLTDNNYHRQLSLEELPVGTYNLQIEGERKLVNQYVSKTSSEVGLSKAETVFKPTLKPLSYNEQLIRLTFKNPYPKRSTISVYDKFGELVIKLTNEEAFFNKVLDFSEVPNGEYSIAISTPGRNYIEKISINR